MVEYWLPGANGEAVVKLLTGAISFALVCSHCCDKYLIKAMYG